MAQLSTSDKTTMSSQTTSSKSKSKPIKLSKPKMQLIERLSKSTGITDIEYIITKLVINNWPTEFSEAKQAVKYDNFCYYYALGWCKNHGDNNGEKCGKNKRYHLDNITMWKLYNYGNCSLSNKIKAYYLFHYLTAYIGFENQQSTINFYARIKKDKDFNRLQITYDKKWANTVASTTYALQQFTHYNYKNNNKPIQNEENSYKSNGPITQSNPSDTMSTTSMSTMTSSTNSKMSFDEQWPEL